MAGMAWHGEVGPGEAWPGGARYGRHGGVRQGFARWGTVWYGRHGEAGLGKVR